MSASIPDRARDAVQHGSDQPMHGNGDGVGSPRLQVEHCTAEAPASVSSVGIEGSSYPADVQVSALKTECLATGCDAQQGGTTVGAEYNSVSRTAHVAKVPLMFTAGHNEVTSNSSARVCASVSEGRTRNDVPMARIRQDTGDIAPGTHQPQSCQAEGALVSDAQGVLSCTRFCPPYMICWMVRCMLGCITSNTRALYFVADKSCKGARVRAFLFGVWCHGAQPL